jgi:hypothetical protein
VLRLTRGKRAEIASQVSDCVSIAQTSTCCACGSGSSREGTITIGSRASSRTTRSLSPDNAGHKPIA